MEKRPTVAFIDREALRFNYRELRKRLSPETKMLAVVKANAYGHGDVEVARTLEEEGCECFGVATVEEGARLRAGGIKRPVIILGGVYRGELRELLHYGLTPVVFDLSIVREIDRYAGGLGREIGVHVKMDTGMGRLGILPGEIEAFFKRLKELKNIRVEGFLSHFPEAEAEDKSYSLAQLGVFIESIDKVRGLGFNTGLNHIANSAAMVDLPESRLDMVRPGIMLYGSYPSRALMERVDLKPAMSLRTAVVHMKRVPRGTPVGYGRTFVTGRDSVIGILPIGYGDGLSRRLSGKGEVIVRGRKVPLVGTVCMDHSMCDLTGVEGMEPGDEAVVIGGQGGERISAEDVAEKVGTIPYEVFCNISSRVPRVIV